MPYPPKRHAARKSLRDSMLENQRSMDMYATFSGKPKVQIENIPAAPVPRGPRPDSLVPLESDVLKQIVDGLRRHQMVGMVERINSGTAVESNADGSQRHITYNHVYAVSTREKMKASDLSVTLKNGPWAGRRFVIECKRPGWKKPAGDRELAQLEYIEHVRECGGYGMFATSWEEVFSELTRIRVMHQQRVTE